MNREGSRSGCPTARVVRVGVLAAALLSCTSADGPPPNVHSVYVDSVELDRRTDTPVVILRESDGAGRELPIWIGLSQAQSIAMALEDVVLPRPNTHDLIKNLLDGLRGDILRVVITELRGHTYYAVIDVKLDGRVVSVDSRPSDAIAVAIRTRAPLYATDRVLIQGDLDEDSGPGLDIDRPGRSLVDEYELRTH